jgi:hypothetical protein
VIEGLPFPVCVPVEVFRKLVLSLPNDHFAFSITQLDGSKPHTNLPLSAAYARDGYEPEEPENTQEEVLNLGYWDNWVLTNLEASDMIGA